MKHTIVVEISEGKPIVSVKGYKGKGCVTLTKQIETALGKTVRSRKTHEYNQSASSSVYNKAQ